MSRRRLEDDTDYKDDDNIHVDGDHFIDNQQSKKVRQTTKVFFCSHFYFASDSLRTQKEDPRTLRNIYLKMTKLKR